MAVEVGYRPRVGALPLDITAARSLLESTTSRLARLATTSDLLRPVPGLDWTAGELITHLVTITDGLAEIAAGTRSPDDYWATYAPGSHGQGHDDRAALNRGLIAAFDQAQLDRAPELIESAVARFLVHTADKQPDELFRYVDGDRDVATVTAVLLSELTVHGRDLARALNQAWSISPAEARIALTGLVALVSDHVDKERAGAMNVTADVSIRGGPRFGITLRDGQLDILARPPRKVDFHVSAEPVTYLLVSYGRKNQWVAAALGRIVSWGQRPWLAPRLASLIDKP